MRKPVSLLVVVAITATVVMAALAPVAALAAVPTVTASFVQRIDTWAWSPGSPDPAGVTYLPGRGHLLVADSEVDENTGAGYHGVNLWEVTLTGSVQERGTTVGFSNEPTGLAHDPATNTVFISSDDQRKIWVDKPGPDLVFGTSDDQVTSIDVRAYSGDTEDPEFDPTTGHLFFIDGTTTEVYEIDPVDATFGNANDVVTHFDVGQYGANDVEGLGSDPVRNTLLVGDRPSRLIYEVTKAGELVSIIDASGIPGLSRISGLAMAPASTNPSVMHYWIVDRAQDNGSNSNENDGKLFEISATPSGNAAPSVSAGSDQTVILPNAAILAGTVNDDGLPDPPGTTTSAWSKVSGPGSVTFQSATSPSTTATFSVDGTYVLRLTADDSAAQSSDDVTVTVLPEGTVIPTVVQRTVASSSDDAEESASGSVSLTSSDLELVVEGSTIQTVGVRFTDVQIPQAATIVSASIQFQVDEVSTGSGSSLTIRAQDADSPATFASTAFDVSSRPRTDAVATWNPPVWDTVGQAGPDQRTTDLSALVREVIERPGWAPGNAMAFIFTGSGTRTAEAFDGTGPPTLVVEYTTSAPPAPSITGFTPGSGPVGTSVSITGSGFTGASDVRFNGTSVGAGGYAVNSDSQITATVPAGAGSGPISVVAPGGTATSSSSFTVTVSPPPSITGFAPTSGGVGASVTIDGSGFTGATAVRFNGTSATAFTVNSDTQITATVPAGASTGPISVDAPGGTATSTGDFTVIPPPTISDFTPGSGPAGTTVVTITGSGFTGATVVAFNGTSATAFTVDSDVQITATVPTGASTGPISVTTPGGTGTSSAIFTVIQPPSITGFSPTSGPAGTTVVTITGSGFTGASDVRFNGTSVAGNYTVVSDTQITTTVPAGATSGPISVTTQFGTGTSTGSFAVTITITAIADTKLDQSQPATNFGSATSFSVDNRPVNHGLVKFDVADVGPIAGAKLRLYCVDASPQGGTVFRTDDTSWGETTVWWDNAPPTAGSSYGSFGSVKAGFWYEVDLGALVQGDGTYSLRIITSASNGADFATKERPGAFAPQLVVTLA
jgi:hypothetical protein